MKALIWFLAGIAAAWIVFDALDWLGQPGRTIERVVTRVDTVPVDAPVEVERPRPIRFITRYLPVAPFRVGVDSMACAVGDSVPVVLPIEQRHYRQDSVYDAWVSGYAPRLDSLRVYQRERTVYREREMPSRHRDRRWGIGVNAGYGMTPQGLQPYIGIGVSYNLIIF